MRNRFTALIAAIALLALASCHSAPADPPDPVEKGQFIVQCREVSHFLSDDPIVKPGQPGASHQHEFYGNRTTDAFSTAANMAGQPTSCEHTHSGDEPGDTAAYWHPTLYVNGVRLPATKSTFYYTNRDDKHATVVHPAGLKVVAGDATATTPQGTSTVYWGCGSGTAITKVASPPQCQPGENFQVHIIFPDCWNGHDLDSADHKSHMAYSVDAGDRRLCPSSHPFSLPFLIQRIMWEGSQPAPSSLSLASGSIHSMHADFLNAWDQPRLNQVTDHCVIQERDCEYADLDNLPFP